MCAATVHSTPVSTLSRYQQVFAALIKYGFEDVLAHPPLNRIVPQTNMLVPNRSGRKVSQFTRYERIRLLCEELGTTFVKFAQIASNRPDLLPEELVEELTSLQDQVAPLPFVNIEQVLTNELSRPVNELLDYIEEAPLASASMAQVHRARLPGGQEVVLKVQRPGIQAMIQADIAILWQLVGIIEQYFPDYEVYQPRELVRMFEQSITEELNFRLEAEHLRHFQKLFRDNKEVFVPELYPELSTERILCLEYVDGYKITDLEALETFGHSGAELALRGIRLYFEQVFEHGFFHADPHPGNIFVLRDGRIAFLDFGMMGTVTDKDKVRFASILLALYNGDVAALKQAILKFSTGMSKAMERELEYDLIHVIRQYSSVTLENIDGGEVLKGLNAMFYLYKIKIPANLLLLLKALVIIEGVGLRLDPQYDIVANIGPYVQRLLTKKYNPRRLGKVMLHSLEDTTNLVQELPADLREILQKIKAGKLHIEFEHKGLGPSTDRLSESIGKLSYTLLVTAVILASAIIVVAQVPPLWHHIPVVGVVGFAIAALLSLRIVFGKYINK